mgnify:CR=1 FL=1
MATSAQQQSESPYPNQKDEEGSITEEINPLQYYRAKRDILSQFPPIFTEFFPQEGQEAYKFRWDGNPGTCRFEHVVLLDELLKSPLQYNNSVAHRLLGNHAEKLSGRFDTFSRDLYNLMMESEEQKDWSTRADMYRKLAKVGSVYGVAIQVAPSPLPRLSVFEEIDANNQERMNLEEQKRQKELARQRQIARNMRWSN